MALTGVRFFAAMAVVLFHHFSLGAPVMTPSGERIQFSSVADFLRTYLPALQYGFLAVDFFFILSGFVLAHVYFQQLAVGTFDFSEFLKKRFARIFPLHLVVTLAFGALFLGAMYFGIPVNKASGFSQEGLLINVFLLNGLNLVHHLTLNGPSWCVSSEWHAYLFFSILALAVLRSPLPSTVTLGLTLALFLGLYYGTSAETLLTERTYNFGVLRIAAEFPIGLALYRVYQDYQRLRKKFIRPRHVAAVFAITFLALQMQLEQGLIVLMFAAMILIMAAAETHYELKWLSRPWLLYGGEISYAIYLVHMPFLSCVSKTYPTLGATPGSTTELSLDLLAVILVIPLAMVVYEWIERPSYRWTLRQLSR